MPIEDLRNTAAKIAYQYRNPAWIVLDALEGMRVFCAPHREYLESEPNRYFPIEVVYPDGVRQSAIGT